jgi:hypothetical protein
VTDFSSLTDRIQKFANDGTFLAKWGSSGTGSSEFDRARGVALDSNDNVYVVDSGNTRIQKFDSHIDPTKQKWAKEFVLIYGMDGPDGNPERVPDQWGIYNTRPGDADYSPV